MPSMNDPNDFLIVYVCPNQECGSYYGSSSMTRLEEAPNRDLKGAVTFYRNRCPECGSMRERRWAKLISQEEIDEALQAARARSIATEKI